MAIFFTSAQIPALKPYRFNQRALILSIAMSQLAVPKKMFLNIFKLVLLSTLFILMARSWGTPDFTYPTLMLIVGYPLLIHPVMYKVLLPEMDSAVAKFEKEKATAENNLKDNDNTEESES